MTTFVVTGRHRTGTSMMMLGLSQSITNVVFDMASEQVIRSREVNAAYDPNPNGYFSVFQPDPENHPDALIKVPVWKWSFVPSGQYLIVHMQRNEIDRTTSYQRAFGNTDDNLDNASAAGELALQTVPNVTVVQFEDMLVDPVGQFQRLVDAGWPIDPVLCASVVDPALWRNRG